ncbi:MAG TPA: ArsR family transcriptional regulator [archaeon]|nr:ArsR family transcriptional regulator [archaeon]
MSVQPKVRVHVEFGELKADVEGTADEVFKEIVKLLNQAFPTFEAVSRLVYTTDISKLIENLNGILVIAPEGPLLSSRLELPADEAMGLCLVGSYVGEKIGKLAKNSLTVDELARFTGKAVKTVINQLAWMVDDGLIERIGKGEYRITNLGIKNVCDVILPRINIQGGEKK